MGSGVAGALVISGEAPGEAFTGSSGLPAASTVSRGHVACLINKDQTSINLASDLIKIHIQVKKKKDFCLFKFRGLFPITNVL